MSTHHQAVRFRSQNEEITGALFLPEGSDPVPAVIICHGAGEFKENYFELCQYLSKRKVAALAIDFHGHGESGGERFHVDMATWVPDVQAAIDFLSNRAEVDSERIGGFGLSSGGTAILEAAMVDARLKVLVALDATVRDSMPRVMSWMVRGMTVIGRIKQRLTGTTWRVPLAKLSVPKVASDPEINKRLLSDPRTLEAFMAFPLPGAEQALFVDTLQRVSDITVPTMVLWGGDDQLDPPETGRLLFAALKCKKQLHIVPGNGHVGHLDRNRSKVFELTADWILENLGCCSQTVGRSLLVSCEEQASK
jgi:alpha-beta hydrolase superfamily lysophospholipase